ncbi:MAG: polyprenyl synthetase family protein [Deltaproteobacteria bacterium]|nr:polyprenyl synthetase family protein [Deltaproteobacteria bacterium]
MNSLEFTKSLDDLRGKVKGVMERVLDQNDELLGEIGLYNFQGGGKMLRPLIYLLSVISLGQPVTEPHLEHSVIFELIHIASLLHDDIIDQSNTRRSRKAAHLAYGVPETILAGDYLASKAAKLSVMTGSLEFIGILQERIMELSLGELHELKARFNPDLTEAEYFEIIRKKTGALFSAAALGAAILSGADKEKRDSLGDFAINYGMSFQIVDDVLDFTADPKVLGKPILKDQEEGRVTLPFILALEKLPKSDSLKLKDLGTKEKKDQNDLLMIKDLVTQGDGLQLAKDKAGQFLDKALSALKNLPDSESLTLLAKDSLDRTN